jgi:dihydrofolate synthase/folylpolyglutamate synthase
MVAAVKESFRFEHVVGVLAVLADKDAEGMVRAAASGVDEFVVTTAPSERTTDPDVLAATVVRVVGADRVVVEPDLERALSTAREAALAHDRRFRRDAERRDGRALGDDRDAATTGVVVFGSITLVAGALRLVREHGWS